MLTVATIARSSPRLKAAKIPTSSEEAMPTETTPMAETPRPFKRRRVVTPQTSPDAKDGPTVKKEKSPSSSWPTTGIPDSDFQDLQVSPDELRPSTTLTNGQCFHWKAISRVNNNPVDDGDGPKADATTSAWGKHNETEWVGCLRVSTSGQSVVVVIRETPTTTLYRVLHAPPDLDVVCFLRDYFQLDEPLAPLYKYWSTRDARLGRIADCIPGVRVLNQDPWECLASFICSSNNNIPRITQILKSIRKEYGVPLVLNGEHFGVGDMYSFPSLKDLQEKATDADLRKKCGMGYRAKYILETMELLDSLGGEGYLGEIKEGSSNGTLSPVEVQEKLIQFCGVGRKVADCVALFSLKQAEAMPVDVHVWNIACRDYDEAGHLKHVKSLTPTIYRQVGDLFRSRFENHAGWAQSLLFCAELPSFRPVLPQDIVEEMDKFRAEEQARKKSGKK